MPSDLPPTPESSKPAGLGRESLNLPNLITVSRLLLAIILFAMIDAGGWWLSSAVLFVFAASTDALDGYLARRYGQVTILGRILDPFVDKIIVGGTFLFLVEANESPEIDTGVNAWMVLIVIGREMFVSSLRGILEKQGKDFSASISGKAKMALQCVAVTASLLSASPDIDWPWLIPARDVLLWAAVVITIWSGVVYVQRAIELLRSPAA
ncbi:MAG: CDP-diacylglycerol--glycerol-3-phosphate 3-phosphatidyltransferase [Planctomycetaceae bacterium]